ncbi:MAG: alpha-galactosidase [Lachnospiraceae bacterium]|nr:alpha-galactosidase [Lachnospiraceae bacterium]
MSVQYFEKERVFKLDTPNSSYLIGIIDEEDFIGHIYYGKKINSHELTYLLRTEEPPFVPSKNNRDRLSFLDSCPMEYPTHGLGDFREDAISVRTTDGHTALQLSYEKHEICPGKQKLAGLPATFGSEGECTTLKLHCVDRILNLRVILSYTAFEDVDVIARSVEVVNEGAKEIYLTKVMSACLDMDNRDFDLITLHGSWARERHINRRRVALGMQGVSSVRGESSHQEHPFMALLEHNADDEHGEVYGMSFVYSGNFLAQTTLSQFDTLRAMLGIHPTDFSWKLEPQASFQAPEAVMVYSAEGIGAMSRSFHDLFRNHLIRGEYKDKKRPILINNWEATYFDFNTEKLIAIAKQASELGIEMLVMDDGWFGHRNDDNSSLGDWFVNEEKLPGGLKYLVDEVNRLGMKFGIWMEPEMISPDSDLYREHPDWAIAIPGRTAGLCRNQYVLDLSRQEIVDYVYGRISAILHSANIEYVKWDMNRQLSDIGSFGLDADRQGELFHRYMLGVYQLQERMITEFPHLLLENCSGGGARFDAGMLYYSPQIWCSDDTDAIERLEIQEGTALVYPLSAMGAHVSDCPNHTVGRVTPFETRGYVALAGTFGYELDVTRIPEKDRSMIPDQVKMYHAYNDLVRTGDYYRLASYSENHKYDCYMVVSKDKKEALVTFIQVLMRPNYHSRRIRLKGLDPKKNYRIEGEERVYSGEAMMYAGIQVQNPWGDYQGKLLHIVEA